MRIIKYLVVPFLIMSVMAQTFTALVIFIEFEVNRSYYAEVLCINKYKPELACKGKCVLMRKIQSKVEQKQASGRQKILNFLENESNLICENYNLKIVGQSAVEFTSNKNTNFYYTSFISQADFSSILRPPILS